MGFRGRQIPHDARLNATGNFNVSQTLNPHQIFDFLFSFQILHDPIGVISLFSETAIVLCLGFSFRQLKASARPRAYGLGEFRVQAR